MASSTSTVSAAPVRARETRTRGTSFVHRESATFQRLAVQALDGALHVLAVGELDKAETARFTGHTIANHYGGSHLKARIYGKIGELGIRNTMRKVPHKQPLTHILLPKRAARGGRPRFIVFRLESPGNVWGLLNLKVYRGALFVRSGPSALGDREVQEGIPAVFLLDNP